jgi:hypothetical protein
MPIAYHVTAQLAVLVESTGEIRKVAIVNAISFDGLSKYLKFYFPLTSMPCRAQQTMKKQVNISFFHIKFQHLTSRTSLVAIYRISLISITPSAPASRAQRLSASEIESEVKWVCTLLNQPQDVECGHGRAKAPYFEH